jgi:hypothetical protein
MQNAMTDRRVYVDVPSGLVHSITILVGMVIGIHVLIIVFPLCLCVFVF